MSSPAQTAANQANAQHSTGPKTEPGKANSSQNNFRHGFTGAFQVLDWERQEAFDDLLARFCTEHQPANPFEIVLVERLAQHFWLAGRALRLQDQCFRPDLAVKEADAKLALYLRYQTTHERAFRQLSDELRKLRNQRMKEQIGFESQQHKQQMHEARLRLVNTQADHLEIHNDIRQTIEAPLPGHMRVPFDTMKKLFSSAVAQVNRELKAEQAA